MKTPQFSRANRRLIVISCVFMVAATPVVLALASSHIRNPFASNRPKQSTVSHVPADGPQLQTDFIRQVPLATKNVVYSPLTKRLYASVPSSAGTVGNSIARINPTTGEVEGFVFIGSEPGKLALSDDGHTLYVSLDGAAAVRRYDLAMQTAGAQFALGESLADGPFFVKDIDIAPGNPDLVAVSRKNLPYSPDFEGVAIYDNGVQRPLTTPRHTGSDYIAFSASAATLYGSGGAGLQKMSVSASGVTVVKTAPRGPSGDFKFEGGLMYSPFGQVYDAETALLKGTFALPFSDTGITSAVELDSSVGRVYFLTGDGVISDTASKTLTLRAFDQNTFIPLGTLEIPNVKGQMTSLVRWGANGLAFSSTGGGFYIIQTTLVPSNEPVPTPTPTPSPTPTPTATPTPTPAPGQLREVAVVAKDIVIDPVTETIFASVPSSVGIGGNSIIPFNPFSGVIGQPVFVGSEPSKLAISDNGQYIYVGLDGAKAVRRFEVASRTAGIQFPVDPQAQFGVLDIVVVPGQPQTVAIVRGGPPVGDGGVAIYDDGIQRPIATTVFHTINVIQYSTSPLILYGHNNSNSEYGFRKMAATSCGVSILSAKGGLLSGAAAFKIENGLAYSTWGRVADPESGTLVGTYAVGTGSSAVFADSRSNRVYFFVTVYPDSGPATKLLRAYDMHTFLHVGTLALPNISGSPTDVVRWGSDGFAFRTSADKVYLLQTSLIPSEGQSPIPAPAPTPPTYTLRGQVSSFSGPPLPQVNLRLSGGQSATTSTNSDGSFAFEGLPFCTNFIVTPGPLANYTFSPPSLTITPADQNNPNRATAFFSAVPKLVGFSQSSPNVGEGAGSAVISVTRSGDTSDTASVRFSTSDGTAKEGRDYTAAYGSLSFAPGEVSKSFKILIIDNAFVDGSRTVNLTLSDPTGAILSAQSNSVLTINDNDTVNGSNPIDQARFFVQQHYYDFLGRYPDQAGWDFWTSQITSCGTDQTCLALKQFNVSGSFFLSIEFQQTGYLVERMYKAAYGDANGSSSIGGTHQLQVPIVRFNEFLPDTQRIGQGVVVGQTGWETVLENNKQAFASEFVLRSRFISAFATTLTPTQFVNQLFMKAGVMPSDADRNAAIGEFGSATNTSDVAARGRALRRVAENSTLTANEFNRAFVLMQYFGYLRRNPNDAPEASLDHAGYEFWLNKLNFFNGNYIQAEMVKAFITSGEYRQRFAP